MLLAQLSDTHVLHPDSAEPTLLDHVKRLEQAVESLNAEDPAPTAVLLTGDLTNNSEPGEIETLTKGLAPLTIPMLALPGNHDDRDQIRSAFAMPWAADDNLSWIVDLGELSVIGLDTTVPGAHYGDFDGPRQAWLADALASTAPKPTVIAMHHPPFASGITWMDNSMLRNADVFADLVGSASHLTRIFCGHLHRPITTSVGGVLTSVGPSTVHHVMLNLAETAPIELICDPTGYQLHHFDGTAWVSHIRYIDTGVEPIRPHWAAGHG
jgi:3',5'-cyclic AMP phosphodiesterase CpdA